MFIKFFFKFVGVIIVVIVGDLVVKKVQENYGEIIERRIEKIKEYIYSLILLKVDEVVEKINKGKEIIEIILVKKDYWWDYFFFGIYDFKEFFIINVEKVIEKGIVGLLDYFWIYYDKYWYYLNIQKVIVKEVVNILMIIKVVMIE